jgi:ABC-type dipeptide/oligopeptide/nickel transport system permease component
VVLERLPNTLILIGAGLGFAVLLSIPLGILAALRPGGIVDRVTVSLGLLGLSMPQFWVGLLLIVLFAATFQKALADPRRERIVRRIFAVLLAAIAIWFAFTSGRALP